MFIIQFVMVNGVNVKVLHISMWLQDTESPVEESSPPWWPIKIKIKTKAYRLEEQYFLHVVNIVALL